MMKSSVPAHDHDGQVAALVGGGSCGQVMTTYNG
jgi:hypothetical protein